MIADPLDRIEGRAYQTSTFDDGLLDLGIGLGIVGFGLGLVYVTYIPMILIPVLLPFLWRLGKARITVPRLGYVQFGPERKARERNRMQIFMVALMVSAVMGLAVWHAYQTGVQDLFEFGPALGLAAFGFVLASLLVVVAAVLRLPRFYVYAGLVLVIVGAGPLMGPWPHRFEILIAGSLITLSGLGYLGRFLRRYPAGNSEART